MSLDLEMLREVLEWLPSDLRYRILEQASHKLAKHPAAKYTAFPDESRVVNPETETNRLESQSLRKSHSLVLIESQTSVLNTKPRPSELAKEESFILGRVKRLNFEGSVDLARPLSSRYHR